MQINALKEAVKNFDRIPIKFYEVYRKSFKGTVSFANEKDLNRFKKKEEALLEKLKATKLILEKISPEANGKNVIEEEKKDDEMQIEEEVEKKTKILAFIVD